MIIKKVRLTNFRSYKKKVFDFSEKGLLVLGANTAGKTNFIEAVYFACSGKSFRAGKDVEVIGWEEKVARVEVKVVVDGVEEVVEVAIYGEGVKGRKRGGKRFMINGVGKKQADFVGFFTGVLFWPEDLEMVIGSPGTRRRYLNRVLSLVDRDYRVSLGAYERGLRQRNRLLSKIREGEGDRRQLFYWDKLVIKNGGVITEKREKFIEFLNENIDIFYDLDIYYDKSVISVGRLKKYEGAEVGAGVTLVGPHRDDFVVKVKKGGQLRELACYGSRGEQRLGVLAIKLCEVEYLAKVKGERPVLFLDDIFSELDREHRKLVMEKVFDQQTVVTATEIDDLPKELLEKLEVIKL